MSTFKIKPNDPVHILVSLPIVALLTVGTIEVLTWAKKKFVKKQA